MQNDTNKKRRPILLVSAIIIILALVIGWHLLLPLLGLTLVLSAAVWGVIVGTVAVLSIAILLFFILTGMGAFVLGLFAFIGAVIAIVLFPIIFPIIVPLLVILLVVGYVRRKRG